MQAIALRKVLSDMGHQATFIDYWPAYHRHMYAFFSFHRMMTHKRLRGKISYLKYFIVSFECRKKRKNNIESFIREFIEPYTSSMDDDFDVIVHGSDQIWRKQPEINTYNPIYFGKHLIKSKRKVSYAASMGILPDRESDKWKLKELLANLDVISVREHNLLELVGSLGYNEVRRDMDPTLLLTSEDWIKFLSLKKKESGEKYALYYRIKDSFDVGYLQRFTKSIGLKLRIVYNKAVGHETDTRIMTADPRQFLELIYNADFIFTSSFHGLAFSLLFHKPFLASFTNNAERAASLLATLNLSDRLVSPKVEISTQMSEIDYNRVDSELSLMRESSINSLKTIC